MLKTLFSFDFFAISDVGCVRDCNEDAWKVEKNIYLIADGMGGHNAGEVASQLAVSTLSDLLITSEKKEMLPLLKKAFEKTNAIVHKKSQEKEELSGMGTTLLCLILQEDKAFFAHVGDSRLYLWRKNHLKKLTEDHTIAGELISLGVVQQESKDLPFKHILTKAIGTHAKVEPCMDSCTIQEKDLFLLATDGLTNYVSDEDIEEILNKNITLEMKGKELVELAKINGGGDNITLIGVRVSDISR